MTAWAGAKVSAPRISYVDGLRAIAVLCVVAFHATLHNSSVQSGSWAAFIFAQGCHGVDLFFVLSGFCLAYPTLRGMRDGPPTFNVSRYAVHRFVRIVPPYYIAIALFYAAFLFFGGLSGAMAGITPLQVFRQALFIDGGTHFLNPSFWTLPIEFRWYFLFPFALWLWLRSPRAFLFTIVLVGLLMTRFALTDLIVLPGFLLGIMAAHVRVRRYAFAWWALPAFVAMLGVCLAFFPNRTVHGEIGPAWEIASFFLVVAVGAINRLERLLSIGILVGVGIASYGIYLVHQPVVDLAERLGWQPWWAALAGVGAGFFFWWFAERPFVKGKAREMIVRYLNRALAQIVRGPQRGAAADLAA